MRHRTSWAPEHGSFRDFPVDRVGLQEAGRETVEIPEDLCVVPPSDVRLARQRLLSSSTRLRNVGCGSGGSVRQGAAPSPAGWSQLVVEISSPKRVRLGRSSTPRHGVKKSREGWWRWIEGHWRHVASGALGVRPLSAHRHQCRATKQAPAFAHQPSYEQGSLA